MVALAEQKREPVPRGLAHTGPVILSYGFRPFFLGAGCWGLAAMALWIGTVTGLMEAGGSLGGAPWHAHEMLFGYASAALAGFLLTAVPNWTGRLPVSGLPLLFLFVLWAAGRLALLWPDLIGAQTAVVIDCLFLPLLLAISAREIVAGKKWKDLKILCGLAALSLANIGFNWAMLTSGDTDLAARLAIAAYMLLIAIIGGRILPSFTRNWLAKRGETRFPAVYGRFDMAALLVGLAALALWVFQPDAAFTGMLLLVAAAIHALRLVRWRGWATWTEGLVLVLHLAYAFVPLGFLAAGLAALGYLEQVAAFHVLTVGAIGTMTLAVMTRATRGHTGLDLHASPLTVASYAAMLLAALLRPATALWPHLHSELVSAAGLFWMLAFALYLLEYARVLTSKRKDLPYRRGQD